MSDFQPNDMSELKSRLDQIVQAVSDDSLPLDDALSLYEEAVQLGMRTVEMVEEEMLAKDKVSDNE